MQEKLIKNYNTDGINVLSLFDGMSCGQIALERAGIKVKNYYASEIKPHAIKVTMYNYPNTIQVGNVIDLKACQLPKIDLLIGGSPCQDFSILKADNRQGLEGDKSSLFYEYLRLLKDLKPKYFLLENVMMKKEHRDELSKYLGVEPIKICSSLVSFQLRKRLYWTNIPNISIPEDRNISFQDYKETNVDSKFLVNKTPYRELMWGDGKNGKCPNVTNRDKICCLTTKQDRRNNAGLVEYGDFCRYLTTKELELAQTVPVGYCECLSKNQAENVLGDGWTVDVISHLFKGLKGGGVL